MEDPVVVEIAKANGTTSAQVLLRFLMQQDIVVIPKSTNPERIKQNFDVSCNNCAALTDFSITWEVTGSK